MTGDKVYLGMVALLVLTGCRQLPQYKWDQLRELRNELLKQQAHLYRPEKYQAFELRFEENQKAFARVASQNPLLRDSKSIAQRLDAAFKEGRELLVDAQREKQELRQNQQEQLRLIASTVSSVSASQLDPQVRRHTTQIELKSQQARAFWEQEDYLRTGELLEEIDQLSAWLESHLESLQKRYQDPVRLRQWKRWRQETVAWSDAQQQHALVVDKFHHRAQLYNGGKLVEEFPIDLGWNGLLDKVKQGDGATPEGKYEVRKKKGTEETKFFRALLLNYPDSTDRRDFIRRKQDGQIARGAGIGGLIEVHGEGGQGRDWTEGCVALENKDMKRLFDLAYVGMPVTVVGKLVK